jgi:exodeoxyribonuclease-3
MKIITWNVNGIRAIAKKGFKDFLKKEKPDILCLQEIKISDSARAQHEFDFADYEEYWNSAQRPGYSGTAILIKNYELRIKNGGRTKLGFGYPKPSFGVMNGIGVREFDREGRAQTVDLGKFYLVNVYFPNANRELSRLDYKIRFNDALLKYLKKLEKIKPVIICGDFNVAHEAIDLARPKDNEGNAGYTIEERAWMTEFLKNGFIDVYRNSKPKKQEYTWWSYRSGARIKNIGWRIDYFCISAKLLRRVKNIKILGKIPGSDHCPVKMELTL